MNKGFDLEIKRRFNAAPEEVYRSWTDADELSRWYRPVDSWITEAKLDLRVGGSYRLAFGPPGGDQYIETGEYLELDPPRKLSYTMHFTGNEEFDTVVTVEMVPIGNETEVRISEKGYPSEQVRDHHQSGWGKFLDLLEKAVSSQATI